ncbi:type I-F CRISPR-associated helicase Cas3f [Desulfurivibrio alkaliphilus]|uniref:CRISPR-associated helicase Cas3 family n=1 Tax=Desulfurivibrio alkaliphilus (strain DSM 19089 / UNIQEM U267 / AHT2) TaxID=589865 RepID=D6Z3U8_DESAT|nr:type I-F CRISPR-associated helicase Cas3f [Desulfurivibrio alkaliphilus]ADH86223.1 CRISPR-associated helicase Cas3 family [Desulfurivibrio alkaliphilus AHT 2]
MNILLISQCSKNALPVTRRVLDHFAERKGERTWQTAITQEGLHTLRKMLRRSARRNTAVACHWIRAANRTEMLWIVGNARKFSASGAVPTNTTTRDILRTERENDWHTMEDVALLAGLAGLFHDFGKANKIFQAKLKAKTKSKTKEAFRHEWVSLRIFQAFVTGCTDWEWLEKLSRINGEDESSLLAALRKDGLDKRLGNPFGTLQTPLAKTVGWLIVAHHRLPKWPGKDQEGNAPPLGQIDQWLESFIFDSAWNSGRIPPSELAKNEQAIWTFPHGVPLRSKTWRHKARSLAARALSRAGKSFFDRDWMSEPFTMHMARLALMLADHYYSSREPNTLWQCSHYKAFANTDKPTGNLKQKLDEHVIGVSRNALVVARGLSFIRRTLPAITRHRKFKQRSTKERFRWQDRAYDLACNTRRRALEHGFFGVNMASTGCGKTFANARIMYGLADENIGCRFSVALGLRTLTLQTGSALRERLGLQDDDLAVLIGSRAVSRLYDEASEAQSSESAEELFSEQEYVSYDGSLDDGVIGKWLNNCSPKLHQLLSAPILVSTIDHLMPATECDRGGRQIAPMLRLFTSDLVLDEPDDFDLDDLPALTRLVHWAGMLGSKVLLSSATLPPSLIKALFAAYAAGRRIFQDVYGEPGRKVNICCAWFDEIEASQSDHHDPEDFIAAHESFAGKRVTRLLDADPVRQAELLPVEVAECNSDAAIAAIADVSEQSIRELHDCHATTHPKSGKRVSIGLLRMANINPLVAVAKQLLTKEPPPDFHIHYCAYHSQHPLAVRSAMERRLDAALTRHEKDAIWHPGGEIARTISAHPEKNHIFVVLATAVAEVGRDHDYDWAIVEPSSMRSIIQLAGRILRHRGGTPDTSNLRILSKNYKALIGREVAFEKPGFESKSFNLGSHDLHDLLEAEQWRIVRAIPRIVERNPLDFKNNLVDLEHAHTAARLFGNNDLNIKSYAALWWEHHAHWCFELQRRSPFRKSEPRVEYMFHLEDEGDEPQFKMVDQQRGGVLIPAAQTLRPANVILAQRGISFWGDNNIARILLELSESLDMDLDQASRVFGTIGLSEKQEARLYHEGLGVYDELV